MHHILLHPLLVRRWYPRGWFMRSDSFSTPREKCTTSRVHPLLVRRWYLRGCFIRSDSFSTPREKCTTSRVHPLLVRRWYPRGWFMRSDSIPAPITRTVSMRNSCIYYNYLSQLSSPSVTFHLRKPLLKHAVPQVFLSRCRALGTWVQYIELLIS